jgi:SAM-dependent methyltransferase
MSDDLYSPGGRLWILEATDLSPIPNASYDAVLASHVLEHIANPVRALREWRRVLRHGGHLLLVVPHKEGTFDHRRPTTPLDHLVDDLRSETGEDDLTHLEEILALHDLTRDPAAGDVEEFASVRRNNVHHRVIHHHTFTTRSLVELVDFLELQLVAVEARWPHDIYCLARLRPTGEQINNNAFLAADAGFLRSSPFGSDHPSQS